MGQIKGRTGNPFGRTPGSKNKTLKATKVMLEHFMNNNFEEAVSAWNELEPLDKVKTYFSLIKYVVPALSSVRVDDQSGNNIVRKILEEQKK